jgi:DNA polymerase-3 subunit chi
MRQIDFYILPTEDPIGRLRMACRITEKVYTLGHTVHIHTDSPEMSRQLDELLWTFRDRSFIPHQIQPQDPQDCRVTLGHNWDPTQGGVLVNLAQDVPGFYERFERVTEIVDQAPAARHSARERYRYYRDRGLALRHHRLNA